MSDHLKRSPWLPSQLNLPHRDPIALRELATYEEEPADTRATPAPEKVNAAGISTRAPSVDDVSG